MKTYSRKFYIVNNLTNGNFFISDNPKANDQAPIYELAIFSDVSKYASLIDKASCELGVDSRLLRSIMFMETTHGYYDAPLSLIGQNKSILPMNINVEYWGNRFGNRETLLKPYENIKAGAELLRRIILNLPKGSNIRQIATLYTNINAHTVNDYGARVYNIYNTQPWIHPESRPLTGAGSSMPIKAKQRISTK